MSRPRHLWTAERDALLREMVAAGKPRKACVAPLGALPGLPIVRARQIGARMHDLGLKLSAEAYKAAQRASGGKRESGGAVLRMTPERLAYLRTSYAGGVQVADILAAINAMAGPPIKNEEAVREHAKKNGIKRIRAKPDPAASRDRRLELRRAASARKRDAVPAAPRKFRAVPPPQPVQVVEPAPFIEPSPEIADAAVEARYARVKAALRKRGADAAALARVHGMPLREAYRLAGEVRREMRA